MEFEGQTEVIADAKNLYYHSRRKVKEEVPG